MELTSFPFRHEILAAVKHALHRREEPHAASRLACLDGLRGVAALIVFICHLFWTYHSWVEYGYGDGPDNNRFIQLPIIRLVISGHAMVSLFFVVGGYVSSASALKKVRSRSYEKLYLSLASSLFRRGIRLYLPAIISTFITMWLICLGFFEPARKYLRAEYMVHSDNHHVYLGSTSAQLEDWFKETMGMTNIWSYYNNGFTQPYYNPYDPHLWTVPMEMRGSLVVILCLLAFSRCRQNFRFALMGLTIVYCVYWDRWECMEFLLGSIVAEIDLIMQETRDSNPNPLTRIDSPIETSFELSLDDDPKPAWLHHPPSHSPSRSLLHNPLLTTTLRVLFLLSALYILSAPNANYPTTPLYTLFPTLTPPTISDPKRFFHGLGASLLLLSLTSTPSFQSPFLHPLPQYLGKISYSLYICHGPVIHCLGMWLTPALWDFFGWQTGWGWAVGFLGGGAVVVGFVVVVADAFWRAVDRRVVGFARAVERWCFCG
ncbi:hypothetical protein K490DRAFT_71565 [Saccharata proteae CBS 121410]|uniref:Acyltransferase 3 domain-containing protein n=1 Tax=Saccharata proteae CBS 121410 TaxID=1314787 RepID=A0A9P4HYE1_9PEZI|nr:hypothetical protein K490DRAFT_71565 [Saccharata proteae CBS 121410]